MVAYSFFAAAAALVPAVSARRHGHGHGHGHSHARRIPDTCPNIPTIIHIQPVVVEIHKPLLITGHIPSPTALDCGEGTTFIFTEAPTDCSEILTKTMFDTTTLTSTITPPAYTTIPGAWTGTETYTVTLPPKCNTPGIVIVHTPGSPPASMPSKPPGTITIPGNGGSTSSTCSSTGSSMTPGTTPPVGGSTSSMPPNSSGGSSSTTSPGGSTGGSTTTPGGSMTTSGGSSSSSSSTTSGSSMTTGSSSSSSSSSSTTSGSSMTTGSSSSSSSSSSTTSGSSMTTSGSSSSSSSTTTPGTTTTCTKTTTTSSTCTTSTTSSTCTTSTTSSTCTTSTKPVCEKCQHKPTPTPKPAPLCGPALPKPCQDLGDMTALALVPAAPLCLVSLGVYAVGNAAGCLSKSLMTLNLNGEVVVDCLNGVFREMCIDALPNSCSSLAQSQGLDLVSDVGKCTLDLGPFAAGSAMDCLQKANITTQSRGQDVVACLNRNLLGSA